MIKTFNKIEVPLWIIAAVGLVLKWSLLPQGNLLLVVGLLALATLYFVQIYLPAPAAENTRPQLHGANTAPLAGNILPAEGEFLTTAVVPKVVGISSATILVGTLFKLLGLSGYHQMLIVGTVSLLITCVMLAIARQPLNLRMLLIAVVGGIMLAIPSQSLVRRFHRDDPVLVRKLIYQLEHPRDTAAAAEVRRHVQQK